MNSCTKLNCFLPVYLVRAPKEIKRDPRAGIIIVNRRSNNDVDSKTIKAVFCSKQSFQLFSFTDQKAVPRKTDFVLVLVEAVERYRLQLRLRGSPLFFLGIVKRVKRASAREKCLTRGDTTPSWKRNAHRVSWREAIFAFALLFLRIIKDNS